MKFHFSGQILSENGELKINIPFNVWEVCDSQGVLMISVNAMGLSWECTLTPLGKGYYTIPVTEQQAEGHMGETFPVVFEILNRSPHYRGDSPYSAAQPIRKIDSVKLITQPNDGLCGQTCIAMLAGVTLDEACEIMHCRDWQASMGKMVDTLDYLGLQHENVIYYTQGAEVTLPKCAILMEKMGRYSHYLLCYDGIYYDPTMGILDSFDQKNLVGYLEIKTA